MTYSLLIWEDVPSNTSLYLIPNDEIQPDEREILNKCHGRFANMVQEDEYEKYIDTLSNLLDTQWRGYLVYETEDKEQRHREVCGNITNVYVSGLVE